MSHVNIELDEALEAVTRSIRRDEPEAAFAALDILRARFPDSFAVAARWCRLACEMNRTDEVPSFADQFYRRSGDHFERAHLASFAAHALFLQQRFDHALACRRRSLAHLVALAQLARWPTEQPRAAASPAFADGAAQRRLWEVAAALRAAGLPAFPFFGTLLGLVRDARLLPGDKDIDLAIWQEHFIGACQWFNAQGWRRGHNVVAYENYACFIDPQTGITFDLSGLRREPEHPRITGGLWLYAAAPAWQRISRFPWFDLETRTTPAGDIHWPQQPEAVLGAFYGDWRVPQPNWDSMISACNLEAVTAQVQFYALTRLACLWLDGHLDKARAYLDQVRRRLPGDALLMEAEAALDGVLAAQLTPAAAPAAPVF